MMIAIAYIIFGSGGRMHSIQCKNTPLSLRKGRKAVAPSRDHVWVSGEWNWNNGKYEHKDGYWAQPLAGL